MNICCCMTATQPSALQKYAGRYIQKWTHMFSFHFYFIIIITFCLLWFIKINMNPDTAFSTQQWLLSGWSRSLPEGAFDHCLAISKTRLFKYIENSPPKSDFFFQIKVLILFHIFAQNIDCGYSLEPSRRGGSNEYLQSMFLSRNKKDNAYPCKPQF